MTNPVLTFINNANARRAPSAPLESQPRGTNSDPVQSYAELSTKDISTKYLSGLPVYKLGIDSDDSKVIQPAVTIDGKHAVLVVRDAPDTSTQLTSESIKQARDMVPRSPVGKIKFITDDFILENIGETEEERITPSYNMRGAVINTTAENGKKPRIFSYAGKLLINNIDGSAFAHMVDAWDKYLRATACVIDVNGTYKSKPTPLVVELHYRDQVRRGYLLSVQYSQNAMYDNYASFSFTMFVTELYAKKAAKQKSVKSTSNINASVR